MQDAAEVHVEVLDRDVAQLDVRFGVPAAKPALETFDPHACRPTGQRPSQPCACSGAEAVAARTRPIAIRDPQESPFHFDPRSLRRSA